ncbi:carboxypeptidase regulatory-like domain-containing protein [Gorillibacterium sp. sgz5001074]|uniref:RCC1 domain-containing protein n=1 Tax=Gorillibacterium sp. sgz5001074 TaxID=3446695 RepID=UPI003F6766E0
MGKWFQKAAAGLMTAAVAAVLWYAVPARAADILDPANGTGTDYYKLVAAPEHTAAIKTDGTVWTWGDNTNGKLGYPYSGRVPRQVQLPAGVAAQDIAAGWYHTVIASQDGDVWVWGPPGEPGTDEAPAMGTPYRIKTGAGSYLSRIVSVASGSYHSLALDEDGNVWAWGRNNHGELGVGDNIYPQFAVQVLKPDQTPLTNIKEIQAGAHYSLALGYDGLVYTWGAPGDGQLGRPAADTSYAVAVPGLEGISRLYAGGPDAEASFAVASSVTDTVYAWGYNSNGQLGTGGTGTVYTPAVVPMPEDAQVVALSVGMYHTTALVRTSVYGTSLYGTGDISYGQLGCFYDDHKDWCPSNLYSFTRNPELTGLVGLSGGSYQTFALREDGKVYGSGRNYSYQLGTGKSEYRVYQPTPVLPLSSTEGRGYLSGVIRDIRTGLPLEGVQVTVRVFGSENGSPFTAVTGPDGSYGFTGLYPGVHTIDVRYDGYEDRNEGMLFSGRTVDTAKIHTRDYYLTPQSDPRPVFSDTDLEAGMISGQVTWSYAGRSFEIWYVRPDGTPVEKLTTTDASQTELEIIGTIPDEATGIRFFADGTGTGGWIPFIDASIPGLAGNYARAVDLAPDPETIRPLLTWYPASEERQIAGYRIFGYYNEDVGTLLPNDPRSFFGSASNGLTEGLSFLFNQIGEVPVHSGGGYTFTGPELGKSDYAVLFVIPVDAYGRYDPHFARDWRIVYASNNTSASSGTPGAPVNTDLASPVDVVFADIDPAGTVGGTVLWEAGGSNDYEYAVYAVAGTERLRKLGQIYNGHLFDLPEGTGLPYGTTGISVVAVYDGVESPIGSLNTAPLLQADSQLSAPASVTFSDTHPEAGKISGLLGWSPSGSVGVTGYELYLLDAWRQPLARLAVVPATDAQYALTELTLPAGTKYLGVSPVSGSGRGQMGLLILQDHTGDTHESYLDFWDSDPDAGEIGGYAEWNSPVVTGAAGYGLFFLDRTGVILGDAVAAVGTPGEIFEIPDDTAVPEGALQLGVAAMGDFGKRLLVSAVLKDRLNFHFADQDLRRGWVSGQVAWSAVETPYAPDGYVLFFLDANQKVLGNVLSAVAEMGKAFSLPRDTKVPEGAVELGIAANNRGAYSLFLHRIFRDEHAGLYVLDADYGQGTLGGRAVWYTTQTAVPAGGYGLYALDGAGNPAGAALAHTDVLGGELNVPSGTPVSGTLRLGVAAEHTGGPAVLASAEAADLWLSHDPDPTQLDVEDLMAMAAGGSLSDPALIRLILNHVTPRWIPAVP